MNSLINNNSSYILNCDLLNKHLIKSAYRLPCVDKVLVSFSTLNINDKKVYPSKAFLIFYLLFSSMSFIKINKTKKRLFNDSSLFDGASEFQSMLTNKDIINLFLFDFISTKNLLTQKTTNLINFSFFSNQTKSFSSFSLKKKDPLLKVYSGINFKINFRLKNFSDVKTINNTLSNIII